MKHPSIFFYLVLAFLLYVTDYLLAVSVMLLLAVIAAFGARFAMEKYLRIEKPNNATVLITGSSSGFGYELAIKLATSGWNVLAGVRKVEDGQNLVNALPKEAKSRLVPIILDVTNAQHIAAAVDTVKKFLQERKAVLHAVINNAGVHCPMPMELQSEKNLRHMFDVNVFGAVAVSQAFVPLLREAKQTDASASPRLVFTGSLGASHGLPYFGGYTATKAALEHIADQFRMELAQFGIKVVLIEPGTFVTKLQNHFSTSLKQYEQMLSDTQDDRHKFYEKYLKGYLTNAVAKSNIPFNKLELVTDAFEVALLAKYPPAKRLVGYDAHLMSYLCWLLPDKLIDSISMFTSNYVVAK